MSVPERLKGKNIRLADDAFEMAMNDWTDDDQREVRAEARRSRAREKRLEEALERLAASAAEWEHHACARVVDCDEDTGDECETHGDRNLCPPCADECGRGIVISACAAALSEET